MAARTSRQTRHAGGRLLRDESWTPVGPVPREAVALAVPRQRAQAAPPIRRSQIRGGGYAPLSVERELSAPSERARHRGEGEVARPLRGRAVRTTIPDVPASL